MVYGGLLLLAAGQGTVVREGGEWARVGGGRMGKLKWEESRFGVRGAGSLRWQRGGRCWEVRMREKNKQYSQNILLNITFL